MGSERLVIKLTGKVFDEPELLRRYVDLFKHLLSKYNVAAVTGGGSTARRYIDVARRIGVSSNYWLDEIGIVASRLNSYLLISALQPYAYPKPVETLGELIRVSSNYRFIAVGGLIPTQSTASVLLEVAEALNVKFVIYASAVGKVYDKDPNVHPDAKPIDSINASDLKKILEQKLTAGEYALIDAKALEIAVRSGIRVYLVNYRDEQNVVKVLTGENPGTIIEPF